MERRLRLVSSEPQLKPDDCLIELFERASNTLTEDNHTLEGALSKHIQLEFSKAEVKHMCVKCPVLSTTRLIGSKAVVDFYNNAECAAKS